MNIMTLESTTEAAKTQPRVLIADDQPDILEALRLLLKGHGYVTEAVTSPAALFAAISQNGFDLILMDLNYARDTTSGREGIDLLARLKATENAPPIVVMTGWATVGLAVEAMQQGVGDFVEKPWVNSRLLEILQKQVQIGRERRDARQKAVAHTIAQTEIASQLHAQDREIAEARAIQQGFLPKDIPQLQGFEIAGAWQPARVVGGDYYDVLPFGPETLGICIGDVAGKGMPAALLMSNLQAAFRGFASPVACSGRSVRAPECADLPQYRHRPLHHFFLRAIGRSRPAGCVTPTPDTMRQLCRIATARTIACWKAAGFSACFPFRSSPAAPTTWRRATACCFLPMA